MIRQGAIELKISADVVDLLVDDKDDERDTGSK
jgi:hypothetical protein